MLYQVSNIDIPAFPATIKKVLENFSFIYFAAKDQSSHICFHLARTLSTKL